MERVSKKSPVSNIPDLKILRKIISMKVLLFYSDSGGGAGPWGGGPG